MRILNEADDVLSEPPPRPRHTLASLFCRLHFIQLPSFARLAESPINIWFSVMAAAQFMVCKLGKKLRSRVHMSPEDQRKPREGGVSLSSHRAPSLVTPAPASLANVANVPRVSPGPGPRLGHG